MTTVAGLARTPRDILAGLVDRVRARIDEVCPPLSPAGTERASAYLETLHAKLADVVAGADADAIRRWLGSNRLFAPLLEALIEEVLRSPVDADTAIASMHVLHAALRVRPPAVDERWDTDNSESLRDRMKGPGAFELLVEIAHDFRSPLTSILFLAEALRDGHSGPVTDTQRSQLGLVYSAAFGLASVASDVMDLARRERDLISDEPELFSLAEVFQSVERLVRPLVEEKGIALRVVVPDRWQSHGHPHAVSRVLLNLTTNALKFTDEGSVEIGVRPLPHGRLEYYVQDTGRGISPEQQRHLFQPFKRRPGGPQEGQYFSGSGVGLSIARRLVRAMGSDLALESSDGKGTRFSFELRAAARV